MKGDFTRSTFQAKKHYSSVRMQQGRLQLDADWNEQADIQAHLLQTLSQDLIGICGVPKTDSSESFKITPTDDHKDLKIGAGRIYVDGILCELEETTTYQAQASYPEAIQIDLPDGLKDATYLAYLDVWQRHISAIEDPSIREEALNGVDTATRSQTIAQVKLQPLTGSDTPESVIENKKKRIAKMQAKKVSDNNILETHLYRIEIHQRGEVGKSTFKWSRDNGIVVSEIEAIKENMITISAKSNEIWQASQPDQWIEITNETRELAGQPGTLVRLERVFGDRLICDKSREFDGFERSLLKDTNPQEAKQQKLKVRRWDYTSDTDSTSSGGIPTSQDWIQLGNEGIQVKFEAESLYETGDYWLLPTRSIQKSLEWVGDSGDLSKSYEGIRHHYCNLAKLSYTNGRFETDINSDLRGTFLPLTKQDATKNGNIGLAENQQLARLHVQGAKEVAGGTVNPHPDPSELDISADPKLLNVGDTIQVDDQKTVITGKSSSPGIFQIHPPLSITSSKPFSYQQPIVRFADSNAKTQVIVTSEGKVGIGTEGPTELLEVKGAIVAEALKLPPTGTFEAGIIKAQEFQLQKLQSDKSQLVYGAWKVVTEGSNQVQFTANRAQNVSFAFHDGNVRLTTSDAATPIELSIGNTTLKHTKDLLSVDTNVVIQTEDSTAKLTVEGQISTESLEVTTDSKLGSLVIDQSLRFRQGQAVRQISTDSTFQESNHETLPSQLAIKTYIDRNLQPIAEALQSRAFLNGSNGIDFSAQNLTVFRLLSLAQGARINEFSTRSELRDTHLAVPTEQAVKTYVENRLHQVINPPQPDPEKFTVQGLPTQDGDISDIQPGKIRSTSALQVGDTITIDNQFPRLITRAEGSSFSIMPPLDPVPSATTLQHQPAIATFTDSSGNDQLVITADGLTVMGGINAEEPTEFSTPLTETKLYVNGRVFGKDIRGDLQQLSSRKLKEDIADLSSQEAGQLLESLNPVKFVYTADQNKNVRIGFISEDVPDLVSSEDQKAINPLDVVAILTKAIQDQRQTTLVLSHLVDRQQLEIIKLQEQVKMLEQKLSQKRWSL
ncbi:MAG: tail fiber domain-containing protein [Phormidium tanganyikae FI6-MK23]|jgi:hypothetical protein|nr:tail fiber domain-containing protein [Phormidium tanganyikae FI6-MK23]